jgi:hypothetical protein
VLIEREERSSPSPPTSRSPAGQKPSPTQALRRHRLTASPSQGTSSKLAPSPTDFARARLSEQADRVGVCLPELNKRETRVSAKAVPQVEQVRADLLSSGQMRAADGNGPLFSVAIPAEEGQA